ncbi:uncharacterized protein LOC134450306 isoform X2 [Engraulis encrasicolus]|uniref:uncharacterized protein LOC134450306 isoform X2 n=1 Tax=Engraulis encrasicolus TaxID=184585 RepID=UPI002FD0A678
MAAQQQHILLQGLSLMLLGSAVHMYSVSIQPEQDLWVELGSAFNLTCSTDCPGGKAAWEFMDNSDFNATRIQQGSVLSVSSARGHHAETYRCKLSSPNECGKTPRPKRKVTVYSFPDPELTVEPPRPVLGQSVQITCIVNAVYCSDGCSLDMTLFRESDKLAERMQEDCEQFTHCNFNLSATDQSSEEKVHYRCLVALTDRPTHSKSANATVQFQALETQQSSTSTMSSTSSATTPLNTVTEQTVESRHSTYTMASTNSSTTPLDTTADKNMRAVDSRQDSKPTVELTSSTTPPVDTVTDSKSTKLVDSEINPNAIESHVIKTGSSLPKDSEINSNAIESHAIKTGFTTETDVSEENSNAVESNAMKARENITTLNASILGSAGALLLAILGAAAYSCKYGMKLPRFLGRSQREEETDETKL